MTRNGKEDIVTDQSPYLEIELGDVIQGAPRGYLNYHAYYRWANPPKAAEDRTDWVYLKGRWFSDERHWRNKGFVLLEEYGAWVKRPARMQDTVGNFLPRNQLESVTDGDGPGAGYEYLGLIRKGGAKEFAISQIVAYQWHLRPPVFTWYEWDGSEMRPMILRPRFPQLDEARARGEVPEPHVCSTCGERRSFNSAQLLEKHRQVAHKDVAQQEALAAALSAAQSPGQEALAEALKKLAGALK